MLAAANWPSFNNRHFVANFSSVFLVVGHELLADAVLLVVQGVSFARMDGNDNGLIALGRAHHTDDCAGHYIVSFAKASPSTVSTRARSLRLLRINRMLSNSPVYMRRRSSAISSRSLVLCVVKSAVFSLRISATFMMFTPPPVPRIWS